MVIKCVRTLKSMNAKNLAPYEHTLSTKISAYAILWFYAFYRQK